MRGSCHPDTPITPTVATPRPRRTALGDHSGCTDWTSLPLSCLLLWLHLCSSALTDQPWGARHPETKELHPGQGCLCVNWMNHTMDSWMQSVVKKKKNKTGRKKTRKALRDNIFLSYSSCLIAEHFQGWEAIRVLLLDQHQAGTWKDA